MNLHTIPKTTQKKQKRLGLGHGSGRGKTSGRGTKGQKARGKIPLFFEGGALPLIKRLPFRRGKGKNKVFKKKPICINIKVFNQFPKDSKIDLKFLIKNKLITEEDAKIYGVKILGDGNLQTPFTIALPVSKGARGKIEKAGGKIETTLP